MNIVIRYISFCIIAILCNLAIQRLFLSPNVGTNFFNALVAGTFVGLLVKYFLDRRYIFKDFVNDSDNSFKQFFIYSLNGIITTLVFWFSETLFYLINNSHFFREVGAIIGLTIGYILKYRLDKKYVFRSTK